MAFGDTAILRSDFSGAFENPIVTNWTVPIQSGDPNAIQESGQLRGASSARCSAWYDVSDPGADFDVYATGVNLGSFNRYSFLYGRLQGVGTASTNGYVVRFGGEGDGYHLRIYRIDSGAWTQIADSGASGGMGDGDKFGLRCVGSSIEGWVNHAGGGWVKVASATDATYSAAGHAGAATQGTSELNGIDNFYFGDVVASTFVPKVIII